ncbi:MAG: NADH-quinone oxidoreductase subunit L [Gammaproteobacteria bacterium]|nr:NADH-quinone oxidoreductase subunit L [Gammaproteobacteria bacterium]
MHIETICLFLVCFPLVGAILAGVYRHALGKTGAHTVTIAGVGMSFMLSCVLAYQVYWAGQGAVDVTLYTWASGGVFFPYAFHIGFLIDSLTVLMLLVVTFVSLLVHVYSVGYMADDDGYARFFSYISLFTFMMLMLVTANNFLQLFFGWEGVGLVSYLLIGFWYHRESALQGSLKAFLVNRVGDFGFILGIGLILAYVGSLDYSTVFSHASSLQHESFSFFRTDSQSLLTVICLLLFVGAMGKSAQVPLHVWLPESMEGPTPISALIHAATMVTAGVFMIARISPLFELSQTALSVVLVVGATGALFTGLLALVMNDIKRVIAYSTLSQLGYMMVAMGVSAYSAGMFHLATHACFKALLFLAAGSVIMGMHHEQDMRSMGGLYKKMPITYVCFLIGTLALCAIPPFAGFYSKDVIIDAAGLSLTPGHGYAYYCVVLGALVTTLYSFRALFLTFHGKPRMDDKTWRHVHESPAVVWVPLVLLAIPSVLIGAVLFMPMLFNTPSLLSNAIFVLPEHNVLHHLAEEITGPMAFIFEAWKSPAFWLTGLGVVFSYFAYIVYPTIPAWLVKHFKWVYLVLVNKYGFDAFNDTVWVSGSKKLGQLFYKQGDQVMIDGVFVNGTANSVQKIASVIRVMQSGYVFHYVTVMILGMFFFLVWFLPVLKVG